MDEERSEPHPAQEEAPPVDRRDRAVRWATGVALALAVVALVDGLAMALKKTAANCPDGTYFPEDATDVTCYAYPQAGLGIAIAALSVVLGVLVVFSSMVVRATLEARAPSP